MRRNGGTLIPQRYLTIEAQQQTILSTFILIQAWKIYDLVIFKSNETSLAIWFILKYFFLDGLLILSIPFLRIPKWGLKPSASLIILILMNMFTIFLTIDHQLSIGGLFSIAVKKILPNKELSIMEKYVNENDFLLENSEHFKGKQIIRFAPDSSIQMNPFNQKFCIKPIYQKDLVIPIKLESVYPLENLQIVHHGLNNDETIINFSTSQIKKLIENSSKYAKLDPTLLADSNVQILELPISKPGFYYIKSATDKKNHHLRSIKSFNIVPMCPEVNLVKSLNSNELCIGDNIPIKFELLGLPPFKLDYIEEVDGILVKREAIINSKGHIIPKDILKGNNLKDISWLKSQLLNHEINISANLPGKLIYSIDKITDGLGNEHQYSGIYNEFKIHSKLNIKLKSDSNILIENKSKWIEFAISNYQQKIIDPITVFLKHEFNNNIKIAKYLIESSNDLKLKINEPGFYSIVNATTKFCPLELNVHENLVEIEKINPPEILINYQPILDSCIGTIGYHFQFNFNGSGNYEIGYKISRLDPQTKKPIKVSKVDIIKFNNNNSNKEDFGEWEFKPGDGVWSVEFITLSDRYYRGVKINEGKYLTTFKSKPSVLLKFPNNNNNNLVCNGGTKDILIQFDGGLFNVVYDLIKLDNGEIIGEWQLVNQTESALIKTPNLDGGKYSLRIKHIKDLNSDCQINLSEIKFEVDSNIPQISIVEKEIEIVQGSKARVPLIGKGSVNMEYSFNEGKPIQLKNWNVNNGFIVDEEGTYSLISMNQNGCLGSASGSVKVTYLPKPTISKSDDLIVDNVQCIGAPDQKIKFRLSGVAPFLINYQVSQANGEVIEELIKVEGNLFELVLNNNESGFSTYKIIGIYDSNYTIDVIDKLTGEGKYKFSNIEFKHQVLDAPHGYFIGSHLESCSASIDKLNPIRLALMGEGSKSVKLSLEHNGMRSNLQVDNISEEFLNLNTLLKIENVGNYIVSLDEIIDANSCQSNYFNNENMFTISVTPNPSVQHLGSEARSLDNEDSYYCVGDHVSYKLYGNPPFNLVYEFNGVSQSVQVDGHFFKRRAQRKGTFKLLSIEEINGGCLVELDEREIQVYPLPTVTIGKGDFVEEDIQLGEQVALIFDFEGVPPFGVAFIREELGQHGKIVEREKIENIQEHQLQIMKGLEGVYQAVQVSDRYCSVER
ncbi:Pom152 protein [Martiniozyma asiatica (nom. inval.)]|nr:Pom152 protein [Martiniozyma asiatica]